MRVLVIIKANEDSENGVMPSEKLIADMTTFNEELVANGIMLSGEGLHPSSQGKRVLYQHDGSTTVVDGPFSETKELIAGFWIWQVDSIDEAVEWARKIPGADESKPGEVGTVELRPIFSAEDFAEHISPELAAREAELAKKLGEQQS